MGKRSLMPVKESGDGRRRTPKACEHCRAVKARCQPSEHPGVCMKCLLTKRECVSRSKARPRRARTAALIDTGATHTTQNSSSSTFELDFSVSSVAPEGTLDKLRGFHSSVFDSVLDGVTPDDSAAGQTPLAKAVHNVNTTMPVSESLRKPQFNVESAAGLLGLFQSRLKSLPFLTIARETTVSELVATRPFLLLAILAVTSGGQSAQKHALYDDEFLKILGLKYISVGERNLELLQGVLVYCVWYPFHLKPKTSKLMRCMKIAADIIQDLGLDKDFLTSNPWTHMVTSEELEQIRAYLAYVIVWKGDKYLSTETPRWASTATAVLEQHGHEDDKILTSILRLSQVFSDASSAVNSQKAGVVRDCQLSLVEIRQRFQQLQCVVRATTPGGSISVQLQMLFLNIFLDVGSLLAFPVAKTSLLSKFNRFTPPIPKLGSGAGKVKQMLNFVGKLDDAGLLSLSVSDWTCLIVVLTIGFRLSLPLPACPEFDSTWARQEIGLEQFLANLTSRDDASASNSSVLVANRAVFGVLKTKFATRVKALDNASLGMKFGCPILYNTMLEPAFTEWDSDFSSTTDLSGSYGDVFEEMWHSVASDLVDGNTFMWDV